MKSRKFYQERAKDNLFIAYKPEPIGEVYLKNPGEFNDFIKPYYADCINHYERFVIVLMNRKNKVIGVRTISEGGLNACIVDVRIIMQYSILFNASCLLLSHNHPSGITNPSNEDIKITEKIKEACKILEIELRDHVIVSSDSYYSFANEGMI